MNRHDAARTNESIIYQHTVFYRGIIAVWICGGAIQSDDSQKQGSWMAAAEIRSFVWLWMQTGASLGLMLWLGCRLFQG